MPVVALAQLRRLGKTETPRKPTMDDLRESGDIEQEADVIVLVHAPGEEAKNARELLLEKARGGSTGLVRVCWRPELTLFENAAEPQDG
jgi:replicative DNA helicase